MDKLLFRSPYSDYHYTDLAMSKDPPLPPAPAAPVADMDFVDPVSSKTAKLKERLYAINSRHRRSGTPSSYAVALKTNQSERIVAAKIKSVYLPNAPETLVDEHNKSFGLVLGDNTVVTTTIATGDYANAAALATAVESALDTAAATRTVITVSSGTDVGVVDISGGSTLTASLTPGTYTPSELATEFKTQLDALSGSATMYTIESINDILHFKDASSSTVHEAVLGRGAYSGTELASEIQSAMNAVTKTGYFTIGSSPNGDFDFALTSGQTPETLTLGASTSYSGASLASTIEQLMQTSVNFENFYVVTTGVNDTFRIKDHATGSWLTITLDAGTYTRDDLLTEIDTQMNAASLEAIFYVGTQTESRRIRVKDLPSGKTYETTIEPSVGYTGDELAAQIQGALNGIPLLPRIKIGTSNNDFIFVDVSGGSDLTVTVPSGDYLPETLASTLTSLIAAHGSRSGTVIITAANKTFKIKDKSNYDAKTISLTENEYTGTSLATEIQTKLNAITKTELYTIATGVNDKINFKEDGGSELTATIAAGTQYDGDDLATAVKTAMEAVGGKTYTVTYDSGTDEFTISIASGTLDLLVFSGSNIATTAFDTIGFDTDGAVADLTGLTTYTSDDPVAGSTPTYAVSFGSGKITIATDVGFYLDLLFGDYPNARNMLGFAKIETGSESYEAGNALAVTEKDITVSYAAGAGQYEVETSGTFLTLKFATADIADTLGFSASDKTGSRRYTAETGSKFGTKSTFTASFDGVDEFTIASDSDFFTLTLGTGLADTIGFDVSNAGSTSYTSTTAVTGSTATLSATYYSSKFSIQTSMNYLDIDTSISTFNTLIGFASSIRTGSSKYTGIVAAVGTAPVVSSTYNASTGKFTFTSNTGYLLMDLAGTLNTTLGYTLSTLTGSDSYTSDGSVTGSTATFTVSYHTGNKTFTIGTNKSFLSIYPVYANYNLRPVLGFSLETYSGATSYVSDLVPVGVSSTYTVTYSESTNKFTVSTSGSFLSLDFTVANAATGPLGWTADTFTGGTSYTSDGTTSAASQTFTVTANTTTKAFTISSATAFGLDFRTTDAGILLGFQDKEHAANTSHVSSTYYNLSKELSMVLDIQQMRMLSGTSPAIDQGTTLVFMEDSSKSYITLDSTHFPETYSISQLSTVATLKLFNVEFRHTNNGALYNFHGLDHVITLILYSREAH